MKRNNSAKCGKLLWCDHEFAASGRQWATSKGQATGEKGNSTKYGLIDYAMTHKFVNAL